MTTETTIRIETLRGDIEAAKEYAIGHVCRCGHGIDQHGEDDYSECGTPGCGCAAFVASYTGTNRDVTMLAFLLGEMVGRGVLSHYERDSIYEALR